MTTGADIMSRYRKILEDMNADNPLALAKGIFAELDQALKTNSVEKVAWGVRNSLEHLIMIMQQGGIR